MSQGVRYAVHSGVVVSKDGQTHRIPAHRVADLYGLSHVEWFTWDDRTSLGRKYEDYVHLWPDHTGKYQLPR